MFDNVLDEPMSKVDSFDIVGLVLVILGAASVADIATLSFLGYGFSDTLYTFGSSTDISLALAAILGGTGLMFSSNIGKNDFTKADFDRISNGEKVAVLALIVVPVAFLLSPDFASWVTGSDMIGIGFTAVHTVGAFVLASE